MVAKIPLSIFIKPFKQNFYLLTINRKLNRIDNNFLILAQFYKCLRESLIESLRPNSQKSIYLRIQKLLFLGKSSKLNQ